MMDPDLPISATLEVRDRCLCLALKRAARRVARRFDEAFRPYGLTNGQFSLLMSLNRPEGPRLGDLVPLLGMDRTTLTAALKPLERRGLVESLPDEADARARRLGLTQDGRALLKQVLPIWRAEHDAMDQALSLPPADLRDALQELGDGRPTE
ncbi:MarR family transcriptional regulator [Aquicoccus sp. SCR17]|nr:MarR family transcriptional regulator [Carideicomes alvinocaridis]